MVKIIWRTGQVVEGHKIGKTIGFPTINLDPNILPLDQEKGVYASFVRHKGRRYTGALFLGPRQVFGETKRVLEIFLLDFNKNIYGEDVSFSLVKHIRGLKDLPSIEALEQQMNRDVEEIREALLDIKQVL